MTLPPTDEPGGVVHPTLDELRDEAVAWGRRPRRRGSWYVTEHMVRAMRAYGWTIIVGALGQPVMYLLGLALGLAALIQVPVIDHGREVGYLMFVGPALLATAAISVASEEMTYPVMAGFKWRRYFYGFNASPLSSPQIANGVIVGATARMVVAAGAFYLFLWVFGLFGLETVPHPETGWLSILAGVAAGLAFGIPLMAYAGSIQDDKGQFALVQRFLFMSMFLFSGTFYPLDTLPVWLQWIGWISPLWHGTELGRVATYHSDVAPAMIVVHVVYLALLCVVGYLWGRRVFIERLAR